MTSISYRLILEINRPVIEYLIANTFNTNGSFKQMSLEIQGSCKPTLVLQTPCGSTMEMWFLSVPSPTPKMIEIMLQQWFQIACTMCDTWPSYSTASNLHSRFQTYLLPHTVYHLSHTLCYHLPPSSKHHSHPTP